MGEGTFVGLDVHAASVVAGLIDEATGAVRLVRAPHQTDQLVGWRGQFRAPVRITYEAGPTGYGLASPSKHGGGHSCLVAAPSKIPRAPGQQVKNDRIDAKRLARLLRAGDLTPVGIPTPGE